MSEVVWPVEFVDDSGATHLAHDMAGAWALVYGGCLLKRAVDGLPFKAAQPTRAEAPREVLTRRGEPNPLPAAPGPVLPNDRRSRRKEKP